MTTARFVPDSAGETFGRVLRTRRAGDLLFRESRYAESARLPVHYHPLSYLSFVVRGALRERDDRAEHCYTAGSLHAHGPGDPHSGAIGGAILVNMSVVPLGEEQAALALAVGSWDAEDPTPSLLAARCHRELAERDDASDLALESLGLELLVAVQRARRIREAHAPRWLRRVRDHLHDRMGERVALSELAALADVHPVHLVRAFRSRIGVTPAGYQRRLRIERARRALIESDTPLAELALEAGFAGQPHFTRWFRALLGTTPAAYRRAHARRA